LLQKDVDQLQQASQLKRIPLKFKYRNSQMQFRLDSPPHSVAAVTIVF
jgi:hypothetical protein